MIDKEKLYKECLAFWGEKKQLRVVQEECAELIVAVSHFIRHLDKMDVRCLDETDDNQYPWNHDGSVDELIEETADVLNVVEQVRQFIGPKLVDEVREKKLERTSKKLERYRKNAQHAE